VAHPAVVTTDEYIHRAALTALRCGNQVVIPIVDSDRHASVQSL
jgi:hypothetical protein